jgi:hypothetical protein
MEGKIMKKMPIILLAFIIIMTSCLPAFGIDTITPIIPIKTDPIIATPIIISPIFTAIFHTKAVYTTPLYRLYDSDSDKHSYTSSSSEKADLIVAGLTDDGIVAYVSPVKLPGYIPLYRQEIFGQVEILSPTKLSSTSWWTDTGTVGYIQPDTFTGSTKVHESAKALSEGESFFNTSYYYCDDYFQHILFGKLPKVPLGYNLTDKRFNMWKNSTKIQEITLTDLPTSVTGGHKYTVSWTKLVAGGKVDLLYSMDNGNTWNTIIENMDNPSTIGSYLWTMPNVTKSEMKVKIYWKPAAGESSVAWDTSNTFKSTRDLIIMEFLPIKPGIDVLGFAPSKPTSLTAKASIVSPQINLYWTDNSSSETGFSIERKPNGGVYSKIGTAIANATSYKDASVSSSVKYTYRILAKGSILNSGYSNEATATYYGMVLAPIIPDGLLHPIFPNPPVNPSAAFTDGSMSEVLISWDSPSGDYTGFNVEKDSGSGWTVIGNTTEDDHDYVDVDLDGLSGEILYRVKTYDEALTSVPSTTVSVNLDGEIEEEPDIFDGTQSSWAESELIEAYENELTYPGVMYDYGRAITREEFCVLAVKLYEKLTGMGVIPGEDPFVDTDNPDILIAYKLGIVKGISATEFAPANNITRQEMCVMIYRALVAARYDTTVDTMAAFPFTDSPSIASWAMNEVKFCYQNSIMNGTSPTTIDPLLNTPREQAIILINRTYDSFNSQ